MSKLTHSFFCAMKLLLTIKADGHLVSPLFRKCSFLQSKNQPKLIVSAKGPKAHSHKTSIAPLRLKSQSGQLLSRVMKDNPQLLPSAVDRQLQRLRSHEAAYSHDGDLEEIVYFLVIHKFMANDISMIAGAQIRDSWPTDYQEQKLKGVHSDEAADMIEAHLTFVATKLGDRTSKWRLRKLYTACVKFGYYLKKVDERFQLEKCIGKPEDGKTSSFSDIEAADISYGLRSYVRFLDPEMLQRLATVRSKEVTSLIERQERALFSAAEEEVVEITSYGLRMLVLEAVAFGSLLWEAECYVDTHCCSLDG